MKETVSSSKTPRPELRKAFIRNLPGRVTALLDNWHKLVHGGWDSACHAELKKRLEALIQLSHNFGMERISQVARSLNKQLEERVTADSVPSEASVKELDVLFQAFDEAVHEHHHLDPAYKARPAERRKGSRDSAPTGESNPPRLIYLFDVDETQLPGLPVVFSDEGLTPRIYNDSDKLLADVGQQPPVAIVCGPHILDKLAQSREQGAKQQHFPPVVMLARQDNLATRLAAMRAGVDLFMVQPVEAGVFSSRLKRLIKPKAQPQYRVLLVEDDPAQAEYASAILQKADFAVEVVTEPLKILDALNSSRPDLILMDLYMPDASGSELAAIIEHTPDFYDIPIIYLSGEQNEDIQLEALSIGGEDFLAKPVSPKRLVTTVSNRIKKTRSRTRRLGRSRNRDKVTGLLKRDYMLEQLEHVLSADAETHKAMGFLMIELDSPDSIMLRAGIDGMDLLLAEISQLILHETTIQDVCARFGDTCFTVLTQEHEPELLSGLAERIRNSIARRLFEIGIHSITASVSIGIVPLHTWSEDPSVVISKAKSVVNEAKALGGNHSKLYTLTPEPASPAESDSWIRELIGEALDESRFEVHYQPMVALHGMAGEYYQTLIRMRTASQELIPAAKFVLAAERHGLIDEIDRWIVIQSIKTLAGRKKQKTPIRFFVSQSGSAISDRNRLSWLANEIKQHGLKDPSGLSFEFKLEDVSANLSMAQAFFKALHELGINTLLTGILGQEYCFQVLEHLPTRFVKLHHSCAEGDAAKLTSLVHELHDRKKVVIAPLVEDPACIAKLWSAGADFVQGNFIQRPDGSLGYDFRDSILG